MHCTSSVQVGLDPCAPLLLSLCHGSWWLTNGQRVTGLARGRMFDIKPPSRHDVLTFDVEALTPTISVAELTEGTTRC